ncbi:multicopper oxidase-domain-containing protein [Aspergillus avenaceus]|uniref:Multicopper oxidase-domain-containing protein n=1 Tax=Aspergillus avenaceus TaxID=36643 RepID=A0A5N6TLK5_ASPAV|nr:multicopper oxidase-domain-containing protein [Aspergillus avenaceus]
MSISTAAVAVILWLGLVQAKLVRETLEFTWGVGSPNGVPREMVLTNGKYPGPDLVFDEDDDVEIHVFNKMHLNTTVHWHGLSMVDTPWSDGVPGLSQAPIQPNSSFIYKFKASPAGTFWYHSHYKSVMQDGQVGALYIRHKPDAPRPYSAITNDTTELKKMQHAEENSNLMLITDWTHFTAQEYFQAEIDSGLNLFCVDSILVNGKGSVFCPGSEYAQKLAGAQISLVLEGTNLTDRGCLAPPLKNVQGGWPNQKPSAVPESMHDNCTSSDGGLPVIRVDAEDGWASLNFIGGQAQKGTTFSVDDHPMWIYEVDGQFVEPRQYEMVGMYNGARYSAMIKLDQTPGDYTIRVTDNGGDQVISGYAVLSYRAKTPAKNEIRPQASIGPYSKGYINYAGLNTSTSVRYLDYIDNPPAFGVPPPPRSADLTLFTNMTRMYSSYQWSLGNGVLYEPERTADTPLIFEKDPKQALGQKYSLQTLNDTWVDIIIQIESHPDMDPIHPPHPIHKHGDRAYIIGDGMGIFNWSSVDEGMRERPDLFYLDKPALRDTFTTNTITAMLDPGVWIAIRYHIRGPFPSLLHCHIATHQEGGMALALLDGIDLWSELPTPQEVARLQHPRPKPGPIP